MATFVVVRRTGRLARNQKAICDSVHLEYLLCVCVYRTEGLPTPFHFYASSDWIVASVAQCFFCKSIHVTKESSV